jgi:hypothetical protein
MSSQMKPINLADSLPDSLNFSELAKSAIYQCSPDHKSFPIKGQSLSSSNKAKGKDKTPCPNDLRDQTELTSWLRSAIEKQDVDAQNLRNDYPASVYYYDEKRKLIYIARHSSSPPNFYHGYPIAKKSIPSWFAKKKGLTTKDIQNLNNR